MLEGIERKQNKIFKIVIPKSNLKLVAQDII